MGLNQLGLGFVFTAKDLASANMTKLGRSFTSFERTASQSLTRTQVALRQFGIGAGIAIAGALGLGAALNFADKAGKFEQGMARVSAISNIATDSVEATQLRATALDQALNSRFSPTEASEGLADFASQGFTAQQQMQALGPALLLASAGMIPVSDAASSMTSALKVFSLQASEAGVVTDKLLKIANLTSLQSEDLTLALGTVGRGAGLAKQNLDEMLVAMGLVKNTGVDVSVAASSVSSGLIFMAENADEFQKVLGVSVTDANGKFRDFGDVVLDTRDALGSKYTNEAKKAAVVSNLFGKFGATAFQAVSEQLDAFRDSSGNLVGAREALTMMRKEMQDAGGTAEEFSAKMMNTFEGQKAAMAASSEALQIVLGEPIAKGIAPVVTMVKEGIQSLVRFIESIPEPVKVVFAKIAVGLAATVTAIGTLLALKGAVMLIGSAMGFLGVSISSVLAPLAILVGAAAVAGLVISAFMVDAERSGSGALGSLKDTFARIKLFFQGLVQYFQDGALSGEILADLNKAENEGVKSFLGTVLDFGVRVMEFFDGVREGFKAFVKVSQPVFDEFKTALGGLSESLGFFTGDITEASGAPMKGFQQSGAAVGVTLGQMAVLVVQGMTLIVKVIGGVLTALDMMGLTVSDVVKAWIIYRGILLTITAIKAAATIKTLAFAAAQALLGKTTAATGRVMGGLRGGMAVMDARMNSMAGTMLGKAGLVGAAGLAGYAFGQWLDETFGLSDGIADLTGDLTGLNDEIDRHNKLAGGVTRKRGLTDKHSAAEAAKFTAKQRGMSLEQFQEVRIAELRAEGFAAEVSDDGSIKTVGRLDLSGRVHEFGSPSSANAAAMTASAGGTPAVTGGGSQADMAKLMEEIRGSDEKMAAALKALGERPTQVAVMIGEEQIATATARAQTNERARAFAPVGAEG